MASTAAGDGSRPGVEGRRPHDPRVVGDAPARLRADAAHNRRALLDAASATFAEEGMDASIARIAARAGIGKGTVFRHFATKQHLVVAIFCDRLDRLADLGAELSTAPDPAAALSEFMTVGVEQQASDRSFCQAATGDTRNDPAVRAASVRLAEVAETLTARARDAGSIRADVTGQDVVLLLGAACQAAAPVAATAPELWRRYLALIFDGLRPQAAHPLPHPAPTRTQLADEAAAAGSAG
ncbi:TetR/AcrR family transcriptional regulator [Embleya hyalina]|uniref:TetR family transcriptional regulator n=1 Tax=Embleya hyalina TaxID=516124 RepID=A0A401Z0E3_9ACTN|nr:TetR/AcrR family transcriptional regulator [Embleya hyalina]GCE00298.1 TetR family transcriptional regulator [Embleya hyalina]